MGYIYKIINDVDHKIYVGQTINSIKYRWWHHLYKGRNPNKPETDYPLYRAMRKYGESHFSISIIEEVNDDLLNEREIYWIKQLNSITPYGYNCSFGGEGETKFDHNEILNYFLEESNLNASKTARHFGCSLVTVLKILENNNLSGNGQNQPVYQIDLKTGKIVNKFNSISDAMTAMNLGMTQLWSAVNGQAKTAGGYAWCKVNEYQDFNLKEHLDNKKIKIRCVEKNLIFNSLIEAAKWLVNNGFSTAKSATTTAKSLSNGIKKNIVSFGFHWERIN